MKKLLIWGTGSTCTSMLRFFDSEKEDAQIIAFIDNDPRRQGDVFEGKPVIAPSQINQFQYDEILICSVYSDEIYQQLKNDLHIAEDKKIVLVNQFYYARKVMLRKYSDYYNGNTVIADEELREVLDYLRHNPIVDTFCYDFSKTHDEHVSDIPVYLDKTAKLLYVIENGKRLYFSKKFDTERKVAQYYNSILKEQDKRSPHRYEYDGFTINNGDIAIDAGVAEGNFALSVIDKVSKIYLFEVDDNWLEALHYTFRPYNDKVVIVKGYLSDNDLEECITLDNVVLDEKVDFIKMDIEGDELKALMGAKRLLAMSEIKIVACVYHKADDNRNIGDFLGGFGFKTKNSYGYMLFIYDSMAQHDLLDFRRGLIFAQR